MCDLVALVNSVKLQLTTFIAARPGNKDDASSDQQQRHLPFTWVLEQLVLLVRQYSGGVSQAVILTSLLEDWNNKGGKRLNKHATPGFTTLSQLLSGYEGPAAIKVQVTKVEGRPAWDHPQPTSALPPLLVLQDATKQKPVQMYLHTSLYPFCFGSKPLLLDGSQVRIGGCRVRRPPKTTSLPPRLLPSAHLVLELGSQAEAAAAFQPLQIYSLAEVMGVEVGQEDRKYVECVVACTVLRIEDNGSATTVLSTRTGQCCSVCLGQEGMRQLAVELRLLDDQVQYASLLRPGEELLIKHPLLTTGFGPNETPFLELSRDSLVAVVVSVTAAGLSGESAQQDVAAHDSLQSKTRPATAPVECMPACPGQPTSSGGSALAALRPGQSNVAVLVRVMDVVVHVSRQSSSFTLKLQDLSGLVEAELPLAAAGRQSKALYSCRPGHLLFLSGLTVRAGGSTGPSPMDTNDSPAAAAGVVTWREDDPRAQAVNISTLLGVLMSPIFHDRIVPLSEVGREQGNLAVVLCRVTVAAAPHVLVKRCHAICGRSLRRASLGCGDMFDEELPGADTAGEATAPSPGLYRTDDAGLWTCGFCHMDCSAAGTIPCFSICLTLRDASDSTAPAVEVQAEGSAAEQLLQVVAMRYTHWSAAQQAQHAGSMLGMELLASVVQPPACEGDLPLPPQLVAVRPVAA